MMIIGPTSRTFLISFAAGTLTGYAFRTAQSTYASETHQVPANNKERNPQQNSTGWKDDTRFHLPRK